MTLHTVYILAQVGRLMIERDEARREICYQKVDANKPGKKPPSSYAEYAVSRGWDCFEGRGES